MYIHTVYWVVHLSCTLFPTLQRQGAVSDKPQRWPPPTGDVWAAVSAASSSLPLQVLPGSQPQPWRCCRKCLCHHPSGGESGNWPSIGVSVKGCDLGECHGNQCHGYLHPHCHRAVGRQHQWSRTRFDIWVWCKPSYWPRTWTFAQKWGQFCTLLLSWSTSCTASEHSLRYWCVWIHVWGEDNASTQLAVLYTVEPFITPGRSNVNSDSSSSSPTPMPLLSVISTLLMAAAFGACSLLF